MSNRKQRNAALSPTGAYAGSRTEWVVCPLLIVITLAVFWPVQRHAFLHYDDDAYIYENPNVATGLKPANVRWALTAMHSFNWHPVTWLSHMLDVQVYGLDPAGHHRTNLLIHLANVLLLYLVLRRITGCGWRAALVAALFAVHPLHVESVAWAAERKDLLSTLFMLLAIGAYALYVERPGAARYLTLLLLYVLGLMSKPMAVTLPFLLLLLDYWPLARLGPGGKSLWKLIREKLPLGVLAIAAGIITVVAQGSGGGAAIPVLHPAGTRIAIGGISCVRFLAKTIWPVGLAVPYPYPDLRHIVLEGLGAVLILVLITVAAIRAGRKRPYFMVGWFWYLAALLPVMGVVQAGGLATADRYTYTTIIGLFIIVAWGVPDLLERQAIRQGKPVAGISMLRHASIAAGFLVIIVLAAGARRQLGYWRDGITLFTHTLSVTGNNYLAHNGLGVAFSDAGDSTQAVAQFRKALQIAPNYVRPHYNLGRELVKQGKLEEAVAEYRVALSLEPNDARTHHNLGYALGLLGRTKEAIVAYREAVRLQPQSGESHNDLSVLLYAEGRYEEAWREIRLAGRNGYEPNPEFLKMLAARMPEPSRQPQ